MRKSELFTGIALLGGVLFAIPTTVLSAQERIHGAIGSHARVFLKGNIHPKIRVAMDRGAVEPGMKVNYMTLVMKPSEQQAAELAEFLEQQRDPASPDYQRRLTPEEFGDRFGVNQNDLGKITSWLQTEGFVVEQVARAKNWIAFSGTAAHVSMTFHTGLHRYSLDGETHFANAVEPSIPAVLADVVQSVRGLDDFRPKAPRLKQFHPELVVGPNYTTSTGVHYLAPDDLKVIYNIAPLYTAGYNGTGQRLVIPGQTAINLADIRTFRSTFGLPVSDPQLVLYGTDPGVRSSDQMEASLDVEWAGAVARNATIVYVYSSNVFDSLQYAIDQNLGTVISLSYGGCESDTPSNLQAVAQQANAQGITWVNSSGDSGAAGCDPQGASISTRGLSVTFPANVPEVTGVGGTEFAETGNTGWNSTNGTTLGSATTYLPERAWNDTALGQGISGGGGGRSLLFSKPWWQTGTGVPNDNSRDVPDVSLAASGAHDGYMVYYQGTMYSVGGTSAATPAFAGIVTLLNHYLVAKGLRLRPGLGNINPTLYKLAQTAGIFHDITAGDNIVPCSAGTTGCTSGSFGYAAGIGYDLATGLGSVDAYNLVTKWSTGTTGVGTTMAIAASPSSILATGTTQLTAKVTPVSGTNVPVGTVAFWRGSQMLGVSDLVPPATGTTASASLTVNGTSLATGANTIVATYSPTGEFAGLSASATVTVVTTATVTTTTVTASPLTIATSSTTMLKATVKPKTGIPTGSVTFSAGGSTLGSAMLTASGTTYTATITVPGSSLAMGSNTITANYVATGVFANSSGTVAVTVVAPTSTATTVAASPANIAYNGSSVVTATVKPVTGSAGPTGSVTFALGATTLGTVTLTVSSSTSTAALTVPAASLATGSNIITVSYVPTGVFLSSSGSTIVTENPPPVATATAVTANPATFISTSSTVLTATVTPADESVATGSVKFTHGTVTLGTATLSSAGSAVLTVNGTSLTIGSNIITATYVPTGNFATSSGTTTVTVNAPPVSTTTTLAASPTSFYSTVSTLLTATVKASSGTATGSVTFSVGGATLGSATVSSGAAKLTVYGSSLTIGTNTITATYVPAGNFAASSGTATVTVNAPVGTTTTVAASPTTITTTSSTVITATVKASSGTSKPTGSVTFSLGATTLGSATLSSGVATLTVKGTSLANGTNTITATYGGITGFEGSSGSTTITVQ